MKPQTLLVFDIETVPDPNHHEGKGFPILPYHQVAAIAFLEAEIHRSEAGESYTLRDLRCGGEVDYSEAKLLQAFFQFFERAKPRLVSYNGRTFDLPVLKYRAMLHGVQAPWLYRSGDRYSNYQYRYDNEWHYDVMDVLSDFGASRAAKLDEVSRLCGFPGKFGIDGSKVAGMYEEGRLQEIRDYCEADVLNTYLVYLRHKLHTADITKEAYNQAISEVIAFIDAEKEARPHLGEFMETWGVSSGNQFLMD